jgi:tetratricopeptide (TPR) repeat protein
MTTISLCVITRDSSPTLPDCVRSAQELVDEIIVLDSGRLNGAGDWAVSNGAKMVPYQWTGDLSDARTSVVRQATSDWVLIMDADEQLAPGAADCIRRAVERGGMDCGYLPVIRVNAPHGADIDMSEDGIQDEDIVRTPRLLRRTIDLRWDVDDAESVSSWIAMRARRVRHVDAMILKPQEEQSVAESDTQIEQAVKEEQAPEAKTFENVFVAPNAEVYGSGTSTEVDTDVPTGASERLLLEAWDRYHDNDLEGTCSAVEKLWEGLTQEDPNVIQVVTLRAHTQILVHEYKEAIGTIGTALEWGIHHPNLDMLQGVVAENTAMRSHSSRHRRECLLRAEAAFLACITYEGELSARDSLPGLTTWAANTRLGTVRLSLGNIDGAREAFEAALKADPEHAEATLGLMEVMVESGQAEAILDNLMPYMECNIADAWMLAAAACEEMGRVEDSMLFVQRAHDLIEGGLVVSAHRRLRMDDQLAMAGLYLGHPLAGPGPWGAIGAIVARQPVSAIANVEPADSAKVVRVVTHFLSAGWAEMIETMLEPRAEQVAPGISDIVRRTIQAHGADVTEDNERSPIFIGGAWDSGITDLQQMLDDHHNIEAGQETKLTPIVCSLRDEWWSGMGADLEAAGIGEKELDFAVKAFIQALLDGANSNTDLRQVESTPHTLLHMGLMGSIFPRARFIHVVRDGASVIESLLERDWVDPSTGEKVWCCQDSTTAGNYWSHVVESIRTQAADVPGRYLEVRYEDLVEHPELTVRHVLAFLGETWDPAVLKNTPKQSLSMASGSAQSNEIGLVENPAESIEISLGVAPETLM